MVTWTWERGNSRAPLPGKHRPIGQSDSGITCHHRQHKQVTQIGSALGCSRQEACNCQGCIGGVWSLSSLLTRNMPGQRAASVPPLWRGLTSQAAVGWRSRSREARALQPPPPPAARARASSPHPAPRTQLAPLGRGGGAVLDAIEARAHQRVGSADPPRARRTRRCVAVLARDLAPPPRPRPRGGLVRCPWAQLTCRLSGLALRGVRAPGAGRATSAVCAALSLFALDRGSWGERWEGG
jgi:hypothetical protein